MPRPRRSRALLQAGAGIKGEFENRLKGLIEEVRSSPKPIILFIDEAHTMIGAANLLKPALARGELRTIAATTWSEYKKYFEKDPALTRRFQVVKIEEPSEGVCMVMIRGIVSVLDTACAKLSLGQNSTPAAIEDLQRRPVDLEVQDRVLNRDRVRSALLFRDHGSGERH